VLEPDQNSNPYEYAPGYSLFKVKRAKIPDVNEDSSVEDIREKGEALCNHCRV
jgi:hypothetical protein